MREVTALWAFLGNPEPERRRNRHNVGFMAGSLVVARAGATLRRRFRGRFWQGPIEAREVALLLPATHMNASGRSVAVAAHALGVGPERIAIVHDDMDLAFGRMRIRRGGSAGGHRGVESIIEELGTGDFVRVKLGLGRPPPGLDPIEYVLSDFREDEWPVVEPLLEMAASALVELLQHPLELVMNAYNSGRKGL